MCNLFQLLGTTYNLQIISPLHWKFTIVVHTHAFRTRVSWAPVCWYKCFLSSMHMLLVHVFHGHLLFGTSVFCRPCTCFLYTCFMGTCFLVQVLFVVHAHAFRTRVSWAPAFWQKCFLSSMHMLFVHVFQRHLLFGTSTFCRHHRYYYHS